MHPVRSLSTSADRTIHHVVTALFAAIILVGGWNVITAVCRLVLALGWYVS